MRLAVTRWRVTAGVLFPFFTPNGFPVSAGLANGSNSAFVQPLLPGSLRQPGLLLPFERGRTWNLTGGPHTSWGKGEPYAAVDFAPTGTSECNATTEWVTAVADGVVARTELGEVYLDLDGDGNEQTGWVIFYLHIGNENRAKAGAKLKAGDHIGHPSCEGGDATGTHVHMARKYNGEWVLADGPIPFNMDGWVAHGADGVHTGTLVRGDQTVTACACGSFETRITRDKK